MRHKKHLLNFLCEVILLLSVLLARSPVFGCVVSICSAFIWLCCEYLQRMCCQTDEEVFLICWFFFYLHLFSEVAAS